MAATASHQTTELKNTTIISEEEEEDEAEYFVAAGQMIQSSTLPMVLKTASELNVFGIIAKAGPNRQLSAKEIAGQLPAARNPDAPAMLDRMLRLLATHSVVTCSVSPAGDSGGGFERRYGLGPISKLFCPDENGVSLGPFLGLVEDSIVRASWEKLKDAVLEGGIPFNMVYGVHAFDYPSLDPRFNEVFNQAMFNYTTIVMRKILQKYKGFQDIKQLVDVGGGLGHTLHAITSMYPSIKGINFDLPHVVSNAPSYPGVEHVGGDMFESVPEGDVIFMKWILHDWSDERCSKILENCYKAIPEKGKLIIVESMVTEEPETTTLAKTISQMDVYLMNKNPGGKERTEQEFLALANAAGFTSIKVVCRVCQFWVMEFYK